MAKEIRKLQEVGGGTFTVSIPKEWANEHGLEAGAAIHLYPYTDGSLVVRSSEHDGESLDRVELAVDGLSPIETATLVRSAYAVGYETIAVEADPLSTDQRAEICRVARSLGGVEVVTESETETVVQNLFDPTAVSIQQAVTRMRSSVLSMHRAATEVLIDTAGTAGSNGEHERLRTRAANVNQSFSLVAHHLNRSFESFEELDTLGVSRAQLFDFYQVGTQLSQIADHAVRLSLLAARADNQLSPDAADTVQSTGETTRAVVDEATAALFEGATDRAIDALTQYDEARTRIAQQETQVTSPFGAWTLACLRRTNDAGRRIGETALRRRVRPPSNWPMTAPDGSRIRPVNDGR